MNLQSLVVVLLRLMSLNFLLQVFYQCVPLFMRFSESYRNFDQDGSRSLLVLPLVMITGLIVGAFLLWVFAPPMARFVTRGLPAELSFGTLSLSDCYSVVFIGLGLYSVMTHFPSLLSWSHYLLKTAASSQDDSWRQRVNWYDALQAILPFVVGIILFVNGRKWAVALANRQTRDVNTVTAPVSPEPPTDV